MGLYTSFAMLALSHHIIVQLAAFRAGYTRKSRTGLFTTNYAILGDDIVIADDKIALRYRELMYELDVKINFSKSYTGFGMGEFAKALYSEGVDVTPLPCKPLSLRKVSYFSDVLIINESLRKRGFAIDLLDFLDCVVFKDRHQVRKKEILIMSLTSPMYKYRYNLSELL